MRVALSNHRAPVTRILAIALRMLERQSPGIRLVLSYADQAQGHYGGIYQGGNWSYLGPPGTHAYRIHGELVHGKTVAMRHGSQAVPWLRANVDRRAERVNLPPKHKYVMPLDDSIRRRIERLSMPYPKRAAGAAAARRSTRPKTAVRIRPRRLRTG